MNSLRKAFQSVLVATVALTALAGCRGEVSREPPVHLNQNMDFQDKYMPFGQSKIFDDARTMRVPPRGTVARGMLKADDALYRGRDAEGNFVTTLPIAVDMDVLTWGQERYNIYCSPCHDKTGAGKGVVVSRGLVPPPTYHQDRLRAMPVGELYHVISNGVRTMPAYRHQIPTEDRWAIVAYIRALQRSQFASAADVPAEERGRQ
ncbi:MAG: c-type cytochrome [Bradymonadia bacterium]